MLHTSRSVFALGVLAFGVMPQPGWAERQVCIPPGDKARCTRDDQCCAGAVCAGVCKRGCKINKTFYANGAINPTNDCQWCQGATNRFGWTNVASGTACGDPTSDECTNPDTCDGSGTCLANHEPTTTTCGDDEGPCINQDYCDGSGGCTDNEFKSDSTSCTGDSQGDDCDDDEADHCTGTSASCVDVFLPSSAECRGVAGECDIAEHCTGSGAACPSDAKKASGIACTSDGNPCSLDRCDGSNDACQHPAGNAGTSCRVSGGECDVAEVCSGTSTVCPTDEKQPSGTPCTSDGNNCTVDRCDGSSNACQHPAANAGAVCRDRADLCDAIEVCDGTSTVCPTDRIAASGTVCRAATGDCDIDETCTGTSNTCPADVKKAARTACPTDHNACTVDECDGTSGACQHPAGNAGARCRSAAGPCDVDDYCSGATRNCPDSLLPAGTVCRPLQGNGCDVVETCAGTSHGCPTDGFVPSGTLCRKSTDNSACDPAEYCTGTGFVCPVDARLDDGTVCSSDGSSQCVAGVCTGPVTVGDEEYFPGQCGDDWCEPGVETHASCPADCLAACNGAEVLCNRNYKDAIFAVNHNANVSIAYPGYASACAGTLGILCGFNTNQQDRIDTQLDSGIRGLAIDVDYCNSVTDSGDVCFCHGDDTCIALSGALPSEVLGDIRDWLAANPNEVLTIWIESYISDDDLQDQLSAYDLDDEAYVIPSNLADGAFPYTLNNMIKRGMRVVIFVDSDADWLIDDDESFTSSWGTNLNDPWPCADHGGSYPTSSVFYGLNHTRSALGGQGDISASTCANAKQNILNHFAKCEAEAGRRPSFFGMDFYDTNKGWQEALNELNGTSIPTALPSGTCSCHTQDDPLPDADCLDGKYCSAANTVAAIFGTCRDTEPNGDPCFYDRECQSDICSAGFCREDGSIDAGLPCSDDRACSSHECTNGFCQLVCGDGVCDPLEFCGIDRLGSCQADCGTCTNGDLCQSDRDCTSNNCVLFVCANPYCGDLDCNGTETCNPHGGNYCWFDCGSCPTCGDGHCDFPETCRSDVFHTGCCDCGNCTIFEDSCD